MKIDSEAGKTRGRPRAFDREAALTKAMHLFWSKGYPPSLYAAFGDKQRLFEESVGCYQAGEGSFAARALTEEETAKAAIARLLKEAASNFTAWPSPPGCMVVLAAINCADEDEGIATFLRERRMMAERKIRERIKQGASQGELPPGVNVAALAAFVAAVFQGMSVKARDGASRNELETIAAQAMAAWPAASP
jgi:TetR/AcrR family transcriptional regulator, copper-responsive repressor